MTEQQAQEYLIDLILNYILANAENKDGLGVDLNEYRRYINPTTGQITIGNNENDSSLVLYNSDFRESFSQSLLDVVNRIISNCINLENEGEVVNPLNWHYIPGGNECDRFKDSETNSFGGISFCGHIDNDRKSSTNTYDGCDEPYGAMPCGEGYLIDLVLTNDVLASLSQFIPITQQQTDINENLADEILDTTIYELKQGNLSRQEQINKFFADYNSLKADANNLPPFIDTNGDFILDTWNSDLDAGGVNYTDWTLNHDISSGFGEYITRLNTDANDENVDKTLQWLRDDLNTFLYDIDSSETTTEGDDRTEYQNQSGGYLKFRGLNQAIIIRNTEGADVGLEKYAEDGFTITMWVRFLDKVSSGTLFNYGNPLREENLSPNGFMLETLIDENDTENRYIRLVLRDENNNLRDSHVGTSTINRESTIDGVLPTDSSTYTVYTSVPIDFNEWYFIVASFNPTIDEDNSFTATHSSCIDLEQGAGNECIKDGDFWRNNIDATGYVANSTEGAMCKVEVISKSDLLRARGYQG